MFPHFVETMDPLARDEGAEYLVQDIILQGYEDDVITSFLHDSGEGAEELYRIAEGSGEGVEELYRTAEGSDSVSDDSGDNRDSSGADGSGAGTTKSGEVY